MTLHGGILAAIAVAFARSKQRLPAADTPPRASNKLSLSLDVDYNRRKPGRLPGAALGEDHVGLNISFATLEGYKAGVDLNQVRACLFGFVWSSACCASWCNHLVMLCV